MKVALARVEQAMSEVGRLRRFFTIESAASYALDRLADQLETLDCILHPSAGELVRDGVDVYDALALVDARKARVSHLLGART